MRYKVIFSYNGKSYSGYQKQLNKNTIQDVLEKALSSIFLHDVSIIASGRTDAGVSALAQVAHFDSDLKLNNLSGRMNSILPQDIRVLSVDIVDDQFHARFNAKLKTYQYNFYVSNISIPYLDNFALRVNEGIDISKIKSACSQLLGTHDFTAFSGKTEVQNKIRSIIACDVINIESNLFAMKITGNGFLYNMVRIIMGTLLDIGYGKKENIINIVNSLDRTKAGKTVSSVGLVLLDVKYD